VTNCGAAAQALAKAEGAALVHGAVGAVTLTLTLTLTLTVRTGLKSTVPFERGQSGERVGVPSGVRPLGVRGIALALGEFISQFLPTARADLAGDGAPAVALQLSSGESSAGLMAAPPSLAFTSTLWNMPACPEWRRSRWYSCSRTTTSSRLPPALIPSVLASFWRSRYFQCSTESKSPGFRL